MPNQKNTANLALVKEKISRAKSILLVDFSGTSVNEQSQLRRDLKAVGSEFFVSKNTLINLGFDKKSPIADALSGMNALILSYEDEVSGVKATYKFIKDKEKLTVKVGFLDGEFISEQQAAALSKIPSKKELLVNLLYSLNSPASKLANVLVGPVRSLTYALQAIVDKK